MKLVLGDIHFRINDDPEIDTFLIIEFMYEEMSYVLEFKQDEADKLHEFLSKVVYTGIEENVIKE